MQETTSLRRACCSEIPLQCSGTLADLLGLGMGSSSDRDQQAGIELGDRFCRSRLLHGRSYSHVPARPNLKARYTGVEDFDSGSTHRVTHNQFRILKEVIVIPITG